MENECKSTVTIPLKEYIEMRDEIASLKRRVEEKTIIKYISRFEEINLLLPTIVIIISFVLLFITK